MGLLSSIFSPSSGTPANGASSVAPQPAAPSAAPAAIDPTVLAAAHAAQQAAEAAAAAANNKPPASSLDNLPNIWQTPTTPDGKPVAPTVDPLTQPVFNFDPAKITETAGTMDFMANIAPENISKALSGDATAFADVINAAVRNAVVGVTVNSGNLINQALVTNNQRITNSLPTAIKQTQLMDMPTENPILDHPQVQPLVTALRKLAFSNNPTASAADINKQVASYITGLGAAVAETSPAAVEARATAKSKETDWSSFLN